ncbi:MAG: glycosyltransferase [Candidatus Omnitrophota bacterium]
MTTTDQPRQAGSQQDIFTQERRDHWDRVARMPASSRRLGAAYHRRLEEIYANLIPAGKKILELGCGNGDLLASLKPAKGVGLDLSGDMVSLARQRHPGLNFIHADACASLPDDQFDVIILSDLINDVWDLQTLFDRIRHISLPHTRIILNFYSHLWEKPCALAQMLALSRPTLIQNWFDLEDVRNLLDLTGFEMISHREEILLPLNIPLIAPLANRILVKLWFFKFFALTNVVIARLRPVEAPAAGNSVVSVIVPVRNEAGNVADIFQRVPDMNGRVELIFVEGHSKDQSYEAIEKAIAANPQRRARLMRQPGKGKGDAVRLGFAEASGDILIILDADLTVRPEDLPRFIAPLLSGKAEFVNGVRLVYPMEKNAMRFLNLVANKFFSLAFSWLLNQPIKDTLCGTKALTRENYQQIARNRAYFGDFDPFGDFDLLFGAAKLNLKMVDLPVRYNERTYGTTNIQRWKHGWLLLRMVAFAARKIKFI